MIKVRIASDLQIIEDAMKASHLRGVERFAEAEEALEYQKRLKGRHAQLLHVENLMNSCACDLCKEDFDEPRI